ncbi:MAG TPA: protein kinase, partial [Aggregatilineales bacterium]|nr:protein kinase [Aggregatilineales bacterium]
MKQIIGGRYEFAPSTDIIGRGGMGAVYKAFDNQQEKLVALKQLRQDLLGTDNFIGRFLREANVLRQLQHPRIVAIYDTIDDSPNGHYLVMEYVGGGSLWDEIQSSRQLPLQRTLSL